MSRLIDAYEQLRSATTQNGSPEPGPDAICDAFAGWAADSGISLYTHQEEALLEIVSGNNVVVTTPTGSGKSMIALGAHFTAIAMGGVSFYTAPIKALVSEKFFALCDVFGADNVGMVTGDAAVNADAPIICCTAEILANIALREGSAADVANVVCDEFHFVADPDRGWAWQTAVSELPQAQFVIMSATLGDVSDLRTDLTRRTGRETAIVSDAIRPVPLEYRWAMTPVHETVEEIVRAGQAPVYIVHSTQAAALERAQALLSATLCTKEERVEIAEAIGHFRFGKGFGQQLAKLVRAGIGVHHAGLLPRYRRLVETLAQRGLLKAICGTDTLGVGINVPIRTVLLTSLTKFDGSRMRVLRSREFHQIVGRAGRAGYDTVGYVVAQAPDHVIETERALAKAGDDPKKRKKVQRKKAPEGFVNWTEETYQRLIASVPETLHPRMKITHAMLLNLLERDEDTPAAVAHLIDEATQDATQRRRLRRRALELARSLVDAGTVERLAAPEPSGRRYRLNPELQDNFALNQPLSAFAVAALEVLDRESDTYPLDVVSIIEATLDNPMAVLTQQQFIARGEAVAEMKADGIEYEERMEALDGIEWPKPLVELLTVTFEAYAPSHPWLSAHMLQPKSIVRDMWERAMTFGEFVTYYKLQRSEGLLLRYLSDAVRALRQTVPDHAVTEGVEDVREWLGEVVRLTDSSLLDEWEALTRDDADSENADRDADARMRAAQAGGRALRPVTGNERAFRILVRNAMWRKVELMAKDAVDALAALEPASGERAASDAVGEETFTADAWDAALGSYWDEHDELLLDPEARGPHRFRVEERDDRTWLVTQVLHDPADDGDWRISATVNLDECDDAGELVLRTTAVGRIGEASGGHAGH